MLASNDLNITVKLIDKASKNLDKISKKFTTFGNKIKKQTEGATRFTKVMGVLGGVAGSLAVKEFATFEKQMSKVKAITGANEKEFKQLTDLAKKMGATTAFTAKESADALEFLGMAGLSVQESMDALPGALELAAAGNLSLGESADIATNIMAQFGIKAKDIGRVNDVLAKSATSANTSVTEMAEAMKYMGPVANALKVPLEETAAAVDILANNGIKGGMAGQSFSASLLRITKLTPKMKKSVKALNLELFDQNGKYVGLTKTIKQLEIGTKNMTDEEKAKHIATIFGIQSTKQWLTLLKEGSSEIEKYTTSLENANGAAKKMAEIQLDNLAGSFTLLKSAISGIMIDVGAAVSVYLRPAIEGLTDLLTNFKTYWAELSPGMQTFIKTIGVIGVALTGLTLILGTIGLVLPIITGGFSMLAGAVGLLLSPIGLVIAALTAFTVAYKTNFLGFRDFVDKIASEIKPIFNNIVKFTQELFEGMKEWIDRIKKPFMEVIAFIKPFVEEWLKNTKIFFENTFKNIITVLKGAWNIIKGVIQVAISLVKGIIEVGLNLITGNWKGAWVGIKKMTSGIWTGIKNIISGVLGIIKGIISQVMDFIALYIKNIWTGIKASVTFIITALKNVIIDTFTGIKNFIMGAWDTIASFTNTAWNGIKNGMVNIVSNIYNAVVGKFTGMINKVKGIYDRIKSWLGSIFGAETKAIQSQRRVQNIAYQQAQPVYEAGATLEYHQKGGIAGFYTGGIVPGQKNPANHDQIPAMLDPGELILNRAQQKTIASQLVNNTNNNTTVVQKTVQNTYNPVFNFSTEDTKDQETLKDMIQEVFINLQRDATLGY